MNTSEVIARYLSAAGISHMFGYPGDPSVEFLEGVRREGGEFVLATREGLAGFMAQAYGMITGKPGVAVSTLGPGSTSLVNAVANSHLDRTPMLAISGQIDTKRLPTFTHQIVDHAALFGGICKWQADVAPHTVGHVLRKAWRIAMADRPGPVHLTTPADVVGAPASDDAILLPPDTPQAVAGQVFVAGDAKFAARIAAARRPVVLYGLSAQRAGAGPAIARLAEHIGAAIIGSPMTKGLVPEDHPLFAGVIDMACNQIVWDFLKRADLILAVGFDCVELIKSWTVAAPVIHIDSLANTDQIYAAEAELTGHIPSLCDFLISVTPQREAFSHKAIAAHRAALREAYEAGRISGALNPTDVIRTVRAAAARNARVTTDIGSHKLLVGQGWTAYEDKAVLMSNGLSSMGFALPAAMVSSLLEPQRESICFCGDGGMAMMQPELRTASARGLAFKAVVFIDNALNRIELKQMARQYPSTGTRIEPTDMPLLAKSMACEGVTVATESELEKVLAQPAPHDRPLVIGVRIDPAQYLAQF
ncbi:MAG: thiamine pyrophosphate-binding protein [Beijerinckiaceae bacterium]